MNTILETQEALENREERIELLLQLKQRLAEAANDDFLKFVHYSNPDFAQGRHHEVIAEKLEAIEAGELKRLMLFMPPRSGKSMLTSTFFPAWYIGRHPNHEILAVAYNIDLAEGWGREVRDIVGSNDFRGLFPDCSLRPDSTAAGRWHTTRGGVYRAAGVTGRIAGKGANIGLIDDPISEQDAYSPAARNTVLRWYHPGFRSRLMPGGGVVLTMCVTGDSSVLMANGNNKQITNITPGDFVMTWDNNKYAPRMVEYSIKTGKDKIIELSTGNNKIKVNNRHPFLAYNSGRYEYVPAANLQKGDKIVVSNKYDCAVPWISQDEAWLLGFMFGDGWITINKKNNKDTKTGKCYKTKTYVTCIAESDKEKLNARVINMFGKLFGRKPKLTKFGYYRIEVADIGRWFLNNGLKGTAKTKRFPKELYSAPIEIRQAFSNGFIAADGWQIENRGACSLCNKELMEDFKALMHSVGRPTTNIGYSTRECQPPNSPKPTIAHNYSMGWSTSKESGELFKIIPITKITEFPEEDVYDLTVADTHNFIVNGFVTSNTRWHEEDLAGHLLRQSEESDDREKWEIINIPALLDESSSRLLGYPVNTSYWPPGPNPPPNAKITGWPTEELLQTKREVPNAVWESLYMQRPVAEEGNIIKRDWWKYWTEEKPPKCDYVFLSLDTAFSVNQQADRSVIQVWGVFTDEWDENKNLILLGASGGRWTYPELKEKVLEVAKRHDPDVVLVEKKASGQSLLQDLQITGIPAMDYLPDRDKNTRVHACLPLFTSGRVWVPRGKEFAEEVMNEASSFPAGRFDDHVDALSQAVNWVRQGLLVVAKEDPKFDTDPGYSPFRRRNRRFY